MEKTLFTRLASYSQNPAKQSLENFTTEVLVHLINNDRVFSRIFIRHIIRYGRILRRFKRVAAESQKSFGNGIVDIVLSSGEYRILVEVKITASETETKIYGKGRVSQVQKYLNFKVGRVAYLTTKSVNAPILEAESKHFLGQTYFEDLYDNLVKEKQKLTDCGRLFLQFMEENDMKSLEPFTQHEIAKAEIAFHFAKKCEAFLYEIRAKVDPEFREMFQTRTQFTGEHFSPTYESAYIYTKDRMSGYKHLKKVFVSIEIVSGELVYGVTARAQQIDAKKLNRNLRWTQEGNELFHFHPVKSNMKTGRYIKPILNDLKRLKSAYNRTF